MTQDVATLHMKIFLDLVNCNIIWGQIDSKNVIEYEKMLYISNLRFIDFSKDVKFK